MCDDVCVVVFTSSSSFIIIYYSKVLKILKYILSIKSPVEEHRTDTAYTLPPNPFSELKERDDVDPPRLG